MCACSVSEMQNYTLVFHKKTLFVFFIITLVVLHAGMSKYKTKIKSKMAEAAILDFCTNSNNSAAE